MRELTDADRVAILMAIARERQTLLRDWTPTPSQTDLADAGDRLRAELAADPDGYCDHFDCACSPEVIASGLR